MKNLALTFLIVIGFSSSLLASGYKEAMIQIIEKLNQSRNADELIEIANSFDRIAQKESTEWLPLYYSAYSTISVTFFNQQLSVEESIRILDTAQSKIDQALKIAQDQSEIYTIQAMIYQLRISTDNANAYQYSIKINEALSRAETLNPKNPRIPYLRGTTLFYTPVEYGGGPEAAKPFLEKAAALFASADTSDPLMPVWGSYHNNMVLQQCNDKKVK